MSLKKYVKDNIYGIPLHMIDHQEINQFKNHMINFSPEYLNDILSEIDGFDLISAIAVNNNYQVQSELMDIQKLINKKVKQELLNFIDEIREQEEAEEEDNGIDNSDRLMQEHR